MKKLEEGLKKLNIEFEEIKIEKIIKKVKKYNLVITCTCISLMIICSKFSRYIIYE